MNYLERFKKLVAENKVFLVGHPAKRFKERGISSSKIREYLSSATIIPSKEIDFVATKNKFYCIKRENIGYYTFPVLLYHNCLIVKTGYLSKAKEILKYNEHVKYVRR